MTVNVIRTTNISKSYDNVGVTKKSAKDYFFADELSMAEKKQFISDRIEFLNEKIKNGDTEVSYQIGASSFTEREWNNLIEKYDDIQEKLKEMMREEVEKREDKNSVNIKKI